VESSTYPWRLGIVIYLWQRFGQPGGGFDRGIHALASGVGEGGLFTGSRYAGPGGSSGSASMMAL
jgi:hypothetical protein